MDCIEAGIPIAALPIFGDQPANAAKLEHLGLARALRSQPWQRREVTSLVAGLLRDRGQQERSQKFRGVFETERAQVGDALELLEAILASERPLPEGREHGRGWWWWWVWIVAAVLGAGLAARAYSGTNR